MTWSELTPGRRTGPAESRVRADEERLFRIQRADSRGCQWRSKKASAAREGNLSISNRLRQLAARQ
eukprot:1355300-Prymnesium_polylepis.1